MTPTIITGDSVTVVLEGVPYSSKKGDENFEKVKDAIAKQNWAIIPGLISKGLMIQNWSNGIFAFQENQVWYKGEPVAPGIGRRMVDMAKKGENPTFLMNFYDRLQKNPSKRSVDQLFDFLNHHNIPIVEDGCLLAYKGVRDDYMDCHSGKFKNVPGAIMEMPRNKISDDPQNACAEGFHVGALGYARSFGPRLMICKVDPEHVVSVPYDASSMKMRVCRYEVIGHYGADLPDSIMKNKELELQKKYVVAIDLALDADNDDDYEEEDYEEEDELTDTESDNDIKGLESQTLDWLRNYAKAIGIKNVKGILGGKTALIVHIRMMEAQKVEGTVKDTGTVTGRTQTATPNQANTPKPAGKKDMHSYSKEELLECSLDELRKFAGPILRIVGASKIAGGKPVLVDHILAITNPKK